MSKYILRQDRFDWLDRDTAIALAHRILRNEKNLKRLKLLEGTYTDTGLPAKAFQVEVVDGATAENGDCDPTNVSHPCPPIC